MMEIRESLLNKQFSTENHDMAFIYSVLNSIFGRLLNDFEISLESVERIKDIETRLNQLDKDKEV